MARTIWTTLLALATAAAVGLPAQRARDRDFGRRMEELFQCDERASEEVTLDRWASRRWTARLSEWMARKLEFLL